jgi:hypothetical protein
MKRSGARGTQKKGAGDLAALLFCPRSENGATEIRGYTSEKNHEKLTVVAGELLCPKCPYGVLSRIAGEGASHPGNKYFP